MAGISLHLSPAQIQALQEQLETELEKRAVSQGVVDNVKDLVVRDILPYSDLGFTDEYWAVTLSSATAWNTVGTDTYLDGKKVIGFIGVRILSAKPLGKLFKFSLGDAKIKDIWNIEQLQVSDGIIEGYTKEPVIYNSKDKTNIDEWCGPTTGVDTLVLLGKVAEPAGTLLMGGA